MPPLVVVIHGVDKAGLELVDALIRLRLVTCRQGGTLTMAAPAELTCLLELFGVADLLVGRSAIEAQWEPEPREEPLGVEEVVDVGDATA